MTSRAGATPCFQNYPGALTVHVRYELDDADVLDVTMRATADRPTPVNLAQHTYWNLAGHDQGAILGHSIHIRGCGGFGLPLRGRAPVPGEHRRPEPALPPHCRDHYTPVDDVQIPTGEIASVLGTPFDFTEPHTVGERIEQTEGGACGGAGCRDCRGRRPRGAGAIALQEQASLLRL